MEENFKISVDELSQLIDLKQSIYEMLNAKNEKERLIKQSYVVIGNINLQEIIEKLKIKTGARQNL